MSTQDDRFIRAAVATYVPERRDVAPDWAGVLNRANLATPRSRRAVLAAVAAVVALVAATLALGADQGWWFGRSGSAPGPVGDIVVVTQGAWNGETWVLTAYRSEAGETCFALTPQSSENSAGRGAAMSCAQVGSSSAALPLTALVGGEQLDFPAYIVGPVVSNASQVRVVLSTGRVLEISTIPSPSALHLPVRFYAAALPCGVTPDEVVAIDRQGHVLGQVAAPNLDLHRRSSSNRCK